MKAIFNGRSGRWFTASVLMLLMVAALAGFYNIENSNLGEELKAEHLHAESLFGNKVVLQKELESLRREIIRLEFEGKTSKEEIERLRQLLKAGEAVLTLKKTELSNASATLEQERLRASEVNDKNIGIQEQLEAVQHENTRLRNEIAGMLQEEATLNAELQAARRTKAAYFRIEALRGRKGKNTSKASKTDRMLISFTWPEAAQGKNLYLVLSGPDKQAIGNPAKEQVSILLDGTRQLITPTISKRLNIKHDAPRQEVMLEITQKLQPGMYQADVYTDDYHLGGTQIRLD